MAKFGPAFEKFAVKGSDNEHYNKVFFIGEYAMIITPEGVYWTHIVEASSFTPDQVATLDGWCLTMEAWKFVGNAKDVDIWSEDKILKGTVSMITYEAEIEFSSIPDGIYLNLNRLFRKFQVATFEVSQHTFAVPAIDIKSFIEVSHATYIYINLISPEMGIYFVCDSSNYHNMLVRHEFKPSLFTEAELRYAANQVAQAARNKEDKNVADLFAIMDSALEAKKQEEEVKELFKDE